MQIEINGFLRAYKAQIEINKGQTVLIAGENGHGKSSVITAARAVLALQTLPEGFEKQHAKELVNDALSAGSIKATTPHGERFVSYPDCELRTVHGALPVVNPWAAGLTKLHELSEEERNSEFVRILGAKVTRKMLEEELATLANIDAAEKESIILKALGNGPDVAAKWTEEKAKQLKGEFKSATGVQWGSTQGLTFKPQGWDDSLRNKTIEELRAEAVECRKITEDAVGKAAVYKAAKEHAGKKDEYAQNISEWTKRLDEYTHELANAERSGDHGVCEGCGMVGHFVDGVLKKSDKPVSQVDQSRIADLKAVIANAHMALGAEKAKFDKAVEVENQDVHEVDLEAARRAELMAVDRVAAKVKKEKGTALHYQITDMLKAVEIVSSEGIARKVLLDKLDEFNKKLEQLSNDAGWDLIQIDPSLRLRYKGRTYRGLSKGHRFRADATLQVALALEERQPIVIMDDAECMDRKGRNGLFSLLNQSGLAALVAMMTYRDRAGNMEVPNLAAAGFGVTYVMEEGRAELLNKEVTA